jgi:XTP/dITP diphosphohydrolase
MRYTGKEILVASHNARKIIEFRAKLEPFGVKVLSAEEAGLPEPEETGTTFEENALLKARQAGRISGMVAIGDDSGVEANILDGGPGIHSKRWVEKQGGPDAAHAHIVKLLAEKKDPYARVVTALAMCWPDGQEEVFLGIVEGEIVTEARGHNRFGFDPIFKPYGCEKTYGEMSVEEKQIWSHRGLAMQKLADKWFR